MSYHLLVVISLRKRWRLESADLWAVTGEVTEAAGDQRKPGFDGGRDEKAFLRKRTSAVCSTWVSVL